MRLAHLHRVLTKCWTGVLELASCEKVLGHALAVWAGHALARRVSDNSALLRDGQLEPGRFTFGAHDCVLRHPFGCGGRLIGLATRRQSIAVAAESAGESIGVRNIRVSFLNK